MKKKKSAKPKKTKRRKPAQAKGSERRRGVLNPIYERLVKRGLVIDRRKRDR